MGNIAKKLRELVELAKQVDPSNDSVSFFEDLLDKTEVDAVVRVSGVNFEHESSNLEQINASSFAELYAQGVPLHRDHSYGCQLSLRVEFTSRVMPCPTFSYEEKEEEFYFDVPSTRIPEIKKVLTEEMKKAPLLNCDGDGLFRKASVVLCESAEGEGICVSLTAKGFEFDTAQEVVERVLKGFE